MAEALEAALRGNRSVATAAGYKELIQLEDYNRDENISKAARKQQLQRCNLLMHAICKAAVTPEATGHLDILWDIVRRLLGAQLSPLSCAVSWSRFLQYLQYFHIAVLLEKKMFAEAAHVIEYLDAQPDKLQSEADYKFMFRMYGAYLLKQAREVELEAAAIPSASATSPSENTAAAAGIAQTLNAFAALFVEMLRQNAALNFAYPQLIVDFQQALMSKQPSLCIFRLHATQLPALEKIAMYAEFFTLLAGQREAPRLSAAELCLSGQAHIEAFAVFLQIDVQNRLRQPQVALRHLRVLRDAPLLRDDTAMSYTLTLLYFYVKLVWSSAWQAPPPRFAQTYVEVCGKLVSFFRKSGEALVQQRWFHDTIVALEVLLMQMILPAARAAIAATSPSFSSESSVSPFDGFWSQMRVECYAAHFELIVSCIKAAPHITETNLAAWPCCSSVRKHVILNFAIAAFSAYSTFVLTCEEEEKTECCEALNENFKLIMRHALNVFSQMPCIDANTNSPELQMFYARFSQLTRDIRTPRQARFCLTLAEQLPKARTKFSDAQWRQLLRRIYQTAVLSEQPHLAAELQSDYIAAELQSHFSGDHGALSGDFLSVRKQISTFYAAAAAPTSSNSVSAPTRDKCLLALHEASRSVLKPVLQPQQKHLLYWLDAQYVFRYAQLATPELQSSLQLCAPTLYEFIWVVRAASSKPQTTNSSSALSAAAKLREHCRVLTSKAAPLDRLELLCLAHAHTRLLHEQLEAEKKQRAATLGIKDTRNTGEYLDDLLQRKEFQTTVSVTAELQLVQLAVEAQQAFAKFFDKADAEAISSDAAYIDWEFIVEDLAALANFLDYSGYLEYANRTWRLHYRIASTILDDYSALRALAFFCENVEHYHEQQNDDNDNKNDVVFDLSTEVHKRLPQIMQMLQALPTLRERHQSWLLCCCCQLAHFYAYAGNLCYAEMLQQLVQLKEQELPVRRGIFDLVQGTLGVVQFRILWKQQQQTEMTSTETSTAPRLVQEYVLRAAERTLNQFHHFVAVSSSDHIGYMILIFKFMHQLTECLANRLCDHFSESVLLSVLHSAVQAGAALRIVQILTMYMLVNLQMEEPVKAQSKLKIIEFVMGTKTLEQLSKSSTKATTGAPLTKEPCSIKLSAKECIVGDMLSLQLNPSMEMVRRVAQVHLSPIKMDRIRLSPATRYCDLKRFLRYQPSTNGTPAQPELTEMLQWTNYAVGCMNARIYFLAEEYEQLEGFYEMCIKWWQQRQQRNAFLVRIFHNFKLLSMQHYANYLRAQKNYAKATLCLENTLEECVKMTGTVDTVYGINLQLQLRNAKTEAAALKQNINAKSTKRAKPLRRALEFSSNADNELKATPRNSKRSAQQQKQGAVPKPKSLITTRPEATTTSSAPNNNAKEIAPLVKEPSLDLDLCQVIDIIELDDSCSDSATASAKVITKKVASAASKRKPSSKTTTTTTTTATTHAQVEPPVAPQFSITDLVNARESAQKPKSVASAKKRHSPSAAGEDLNDKMKAMKITTTSKTKAPSKRKPPAQPKNFVIVEDSPQPSPLQPAQLKTKPKSLQTKSEGLATPKPKPCDATPTTALSTRRGRQRKAITENLENIAQSSASALQKTNSTSAAPSSSRRRQKI